MLALGLALVLTSVSSAPPAARPSRAAAELGRGYAAYRAGAYHDAARALRAALDQQVLNAEWAAFLLGESEFYDGDYRAAAQAFERAAHAHGGRPAAMAPFRIADCLWMQGDRAGAAKAYGRLLKKATAGSGDVALARFRIAEALAARDPAAAERQFLSVAREFPAHPLADEALRRAGPAAPATPPSATAAAAPAAAPSNLTPGDRLRRAESLTKERHWDEALAELAQLPADLPPEVAAERDYQIGMTKFHMRRDYAKAGEL